MSVKGDRLSGRMGSNVFEWELYYKEQSMLVHAREKERVGEQTGVKTMSGQKRERGAGGRPTTKLEKAFKILREVDNVDKNPWFTVRAEEGGHGTRATLGGLS